MTRELAFSPRLPVHFQFSQSSLQDYVDCHRRFELRYLQQLKYPAIEAEPLIEHEYHMQLGDDFHRLAHQHQAGVPEALLTRTIQDETLQIWWNRYLQYGVAGLPVQRKSEITLVAYLGQYRLLAKYDLLAIEPGEKLIIVDWKTSPRQPSRSLLEQRLQTIVYRYVLVEAGQILNGGELVKPEQVEMRYWFTGYPEQSIKFNYDSEQHQQSGERLKSLIDEIVECSSFELTPDIRRCKFCVYRSLCRRGIVAGQWVEEIVEGVNEVDPVTAPDEFDFDQIAEVEF